MSDKEVKERIDKEALGSADFYTIKSDPSHKSYLQGYINGSLVERPKAWNEAIDACILVAFKDDGSHWIDLRNKLEALKHKQP